MVSVYLCNESEKRINVEFGFSVKDCVDFEANAGIFDPVGSAENTDSWGAKDFALRSKIMENLVDGALVIEVHIKLVDPTKIPPPFIPENPSACKIIQGMFMNEESADIVFEVGGQQLGSNARKKAKTLLVTFPAHRFILKECSPTLAELCGSMGDKANPIRIPDISLTYFTTCCITYMGGKY
ncbi:hypothetical protein ACHAW5_003114 [Stephanodiscus triporus]|uniref:BTB domain-containing protein n=1 Tax=Stephanodiscus triporus TaxID=2934178 RepID=A0ABD3MKT5_9STRA